MYKPLLAAAIAAAAAIAVPAHATSIALAADGQWNEFDVDSFLAQDFGNGWIDETDGSALSFTFTVAAGSVGRLTVVDAGVAGDTFAVTNFGALLGATSGVPAGDPAGQTQLDFDAALADPAWSRGVFTLAPGAYSISGSLLQSVFGDDGSTSGALRLSVSAVPEPASGTLLLAGLAGVAALVRRRRHSRTAA